MIKTIFVIGIVVLAELVSSRSTYATAASIPGSELKAPYQDNSLVAPRSTALKDYYVRSRLFAQALQSPGHIAPSHDQKLSKIVVSDSTLHQADDHAELLQDDTAASGSLSKVIVASQQREHDRSGDPSVSLNSKHYKREVAKTTGPKKTPQKGGVPVQAAKNVRKYKSKPVPSPPRQKAAGAGTAPKKNAQIKQKTPKSRGMQPIKNSETNKSSQVNKSAAASKKPVTNKESSKNKKVAANKNGAANKRPASNKKGAANRNTVASKNSARKTKATSNESAITSKNTTKDGKAAAAKNAKTKSAPGNRVIQGQKTQAKVTKAQKNNQISTEPRAGNSRTTNRKSQIDKSTQRKHSASLTRQSPPVKETGKNPKANYGSKGTASNRGRLSNTVSSGNRTPANSNSAPKRGSSTKSSREKQRSKFAPPNKQSNSPNGKASSSKDNSTKSPSRNFKCKRTATNSGEDTGATCPLLGIGENHTEDARGRSIAGGLGSAKGDSPSSSVPNIGQHPNLGTIDTNVESEGHSGTHSPSSSVPNIGQRPDSGTIDTNVGSEAHSGAPLSPSRGGPLEIKKGGLSQPDPDKPENQNAHEYSNHPSGRPIKDDQTDEEFAEMSRQSANEFVKQQADITHENYLKNQKKRPGDMTFSKKGGNVVANSSSNKKHSKKEKVLTEDVKAMGKKVEELGRERDKILFEKALKELKDQGKTPKVTKTFEEITKDKEYAENTHGETGANVAANALLRASDKGKGSVTGKKMVDPDEIMGQTMSVNLNTQGNPWLNVPQPSCFRCKLNNKVTNYDDLGAASAGKINEEDYRITAARKRILKAYKAGGETAAYREQEAIFKEVASAREQWRQEREEELQEESDKRAILAFKDQLMGVDQEKKEQRKEQRKKARQRKKAERAQQKLDQEQAQQGQAQQETSQQETALPIQGGNDVTKRDLIKRSMYSFLLGYQRRSLADHVAVLDSVLPALYVRV